jgi:hypothetical protein
MAKLGFKDWLTDQAKRASSPHEVALKMKEWTTPLDMLFGQMETWIRDEDPQQIIKISKANVTLEEEEFGTYTAPSIRFAIGLRFVEAVPIARNVLGPANDSNLSPIGGEGRVDLKGGVDKIQIYRIRDAQRAKRWVIVNQDQLTFKDLDKAAFQKAIQGLFS